MPTIDVTDAAQRLLANKSVTPGHCLEYVSRAIRDGRQPLIWNGLDTALNCWLLACGDKHDSRNVPKGYPAFLGAKRGSKAGDVMLSLGNGKFAATDYPGWGVVGVCTLEQREAQTGRKYLGYAGQFLGYTLTSSATASLKPELIEIEKEEDDDMKIYAPAAGGSWVVAGPGVWRSIPSGYAGAAEAAFGTHIALDATAFDLARKVCLNEPYGPNLPVDTVVQPFDASAIAEAVVKALPTGSGPTAAEIASAVIDATAAQYSK